MNKPGKIIAVAVACCSFVVASDTFAAAQKILSVDIRKILENYEAAKTTRTTYEVSLTAADKELKEMYDSAVRLQEEIGVLHEKSENTALVDSAREKLKQEAAGKIETLRVKEEEIIQFRQDFNRRVVQRRNQEMTDQMQKIESTTATIAKQKKADIVLNKNPGTLYVDDSLDISQLVIDALNAEKK
ncbi:MAG: OmpH family outer membrane protein [Puniceicoccales bacterium]|jgi:Skp family chaperone for outer membrane proteins|nr:OmpH family outer membrane protein [Puniceicoccales bacterium]